MKIQVNAWTASFFAAATLLFTSCSTPSGTETVDVVETADGAVVVETFSTTATVAAVDANKRKVTLADAAGRKTTYKLGPEVANFAQIQVGDRVKAVTTEEVAVFIGSGAPPSATAAAGVALAPIGSKPGGVIVDTRQIVAKVTSVNAKKHKVTFELPDGSSKTVKVGKKIDLNAVRPGDNVTVQLSEGLAISVEKP